MRLLLILYLLISNSIFYAQYENYEIKYFRKTRTFGVIDKVSKDTIIKPVFNKIQFYKSGDTSKHYFIASEYNQDLRSYFSYLIDTNENRISRFSTQKIIRNRAYIDFYNGFTNSYYFNEDCACVPKDYNPCPNIVPIDISNVTEVQNNIQNVHAFTTHFGIDSALNALENYISKTPNEPQYYFYKAWLLDLAKDINHRTIYFSAYYPWFYDNRPDDFFNAIWGDTNSLDSNYKLQYKNAFQQLSRENWDQKNSKYDNDTLYKYTAFQALEKVKQYETNDSILLIVNAWQREILKDLKKIKTDTVYTKKQWKKTNRTIEDLRNKNNPIVIAKTGFIITPYYTYGKTMSYGFKIGGGYSYNTNRLFYNHFLKSQIGYQRYLYDPSVQTFSFSADFLSHGIESGSAGNYGYTKRKKKFNPNINISFYNIGLTTKKDGYKAILYAPQIGVHLWNFTFNAGYRFINKKKFPEIKGPFASITFSFFIYRNKEYIYRNSALSNLFY